MAEQGLATRELERRQVAKPLGDQGRQSCIQVVESPKAVAVRERLDHEGLARNRRRFLRGPCHSLRTAEKTDKCRAQGAA